MQQFCNCHSTASVRIKAGLKSLAFWGTCANKHRRPLLEVLRVCFRRRCMVS